MSFAELLDELKEEKIDVHKVKEMLDVFEKLREFENDYIDEYSILLIVLNGYFPKNDPLHYDVHDFLVAYMNFTEDMNMEDRLKVKELFVKYIS